MKQRVLSLFMALLGIALGAQAQSANSVYVGSQALSNGTYGAGDLTALTEGSITYNSSQKLLTLNNAVINNESGYGLRITVPGLTVKLVGVSVINASNYGLDLYGGTGIITIDGDGSSAASLEIKSSNKSGIHFYSGTLTICNDAKVSAEGKEYGLCGRGSGVFGKLVMTGQYTQLWFMGGTASIKDMDLSDGPQKHGYYISLPVGAKYQASTKTIVDADGNEVKGQWVLFQKGVAIDEENFPDNNFRNWILAQEYGSDGLLTDAEIAAVEEIDVINKTIASLKGIEYFTAVTNLYCNNNRLTSLDVSQNTALISLYCGNNQLTTLDVSQNTALKQLGCFYNQLTTLDVSKNTELKQLYCQYNQLTALDVSKNTELTELYCPNNQLTELDVSKNTELTELTCSDNQLAALDVSQNTELSSLACYNNQLTSFDVSNNTALKYLYCYQNAIRDENMTAFVNSLPYVSEGKLYVYNNETPTGNEMTTSQVAAAKDKGWIVLKSDGSSYEGVSVVPIDEVNFPDANFRNYILAQTYGADGRLLSSEIATVKEMYVYGREIASLKGIEFFTALTSLSCSDNLLPTLDVSKNTALNNLQCDGNQLTALDVSKNTKLTELHCYDNQLATLNVAGCTALKQLWCYNNQLAALDLSENTKLEYLRCEENQLTALDVSKNTKLTVLLCGINQLTALDVSKNTALEELHCYQNAIRGAEMDALVKGLYDRRSSSKGKLYAYFNETPTGNEMDVMQVATAKDKNWKVLKMVGGDWVDYEGTPVLIIDETNFPDANFRNWILRQEYGKDGYITNDEIAAVKEMPVYGREIASLKGIEFFTALTKLECNINQLTTLDLSKNTALTELSCSENKLTSLDLSKNTALTELYCSINELTSLDLSGYTVLKTLNCYNNKLTSLDLSGCTALEFLRCYENELTSLDLSGCTALKTLDCSLNPLGSLDMSKNTALTKLNCESDQLTSLDLSKNTALISLDCAVNQLTSLNVSKNTALEELACPANRLTSLDVSKNTALQLIVCYYNAIRGEGMDMLVNSLLKDTEGILFPYCTIPLPIEGYEEKNEITTVQVAAAKAKGWKVQIPVLSSEEGEKYVDYEGVKVDPQMAYSAATANAFLSAAFTAPTLTVTPESLKGSVTFTSSDETVAKVSAAGKVTIVGIGETTIKAAFAGDDLYNAASASYVLTVKKGKATLTFAETECKGYLGKDFTAPALTIEPEGLTVKYASSDPDVALVNEKTGRVALMATGEVTITATVVSDQYEGEASYKIVVTEFTVPGDLNDDEVANIADVIILTNAILSGSTDLKYDINGDKKVDAKDVTAIVNIIAGK